MTDAPESVARVGFAAWLGGSGLHWEMAPILGTLGDELHRIEVEAGNRGRVVAELVEGYDVADCALRFEVVLFGGAEGSMKALLG